MCGDGDERRAGAGAGRRWRRHADRHAGGARGRQHGRSRSDPTKLIEIVEIGKQLLMTRGSLTTFSIANDVAKYFAIIPALFISTYPQLGALNDGARFAAIGDPCRQSSSTR